MRSIIFYGRTGKFTFRMLATVLGGQSICILRGALVARALAATDQGSGTSTAYLVVGVGLGVLCIVAAGLMRLVDAQLRRTARPHVARREIENSGAIAHLGHAEQRSTTGLLDIVRVGRNREDIERL